MGGEPAEERPRAVAREPPPGEHGRGEQRARREPRRRAQVPRAAERREQQVAQIVGDPDEGLEQAPVRGSVLAEAGRGLRDGALEHSRRSVVERMCERRRRVDPLQAVLLERQRAQERRADRPRVDRRADVVAEARQRQLGRPHPAADRVGGLEHQHRTARPRKDDRRCQSVRAGTDDDGVGHRPSVLSGLGRQALAREPR